VIYLASNNEGRAAGAAADRGVNISAAGERTIESSQPLLLVRDVT